jgi:hypothetical protein
MRPLTSAGSKSQPVVQRRVGALGRSQISARVKQAFRYCALFRFGHSAPEIIKFPRKQPWSIWRIVLKAPLAPHSPSPQGPRASSPAVAESSQATDGGARLISPESGLNVGVSPWARHRSRIHSMPLRLQGPTCGARLG